MGITKMADEFPPEFKFNGDEQEPETFYQEELKDLRVEKLSQRVTLLSILLPCLIAVAIYFGYRDLSGRVSQGSDTESLEVQRLTRELENLAKDFNDKLITFSTTLSTQDKDLGNTLEGRLTVIGKNVDGLQNNVKSLDEDLKKTGETIERLNASKADKKSQALAIEKINGAITPLQAELDKLKTVGREIKTVSDDIANLESKLTKQLAIVTESMEQNKKDYAQIQDSLTKLSGKAVDKDTLALEIIKLRNYFQSQIAKEVSDLNQRIDSLKKEIDGIEKISRSQQQSLKKVARKTSLPQPSATDNAGSVSQTTAAPPGSIVEKDLNE
jgi:chromosome segregation ATPase